MEKNAPQYIYSSQIASHGVVFFSYFNLLLKFFYFYCIVIAMVCQSCSKLDKSCYTDFSFEKKPAIQYSAMCLVIKGPRLKLRHTCTLLCMWESVSEDGANLTPGRKIKVARKMYPCDKPLNFLNIWCWYSIQLSIHVTFLLSIMNNLCQVLCKHAW